MGALDRFASWTDIHESALMKPFMAYSLVLALVDEARPLRALAAVRPSAPPRRRVPESEATRSLLWLADVLETPEDEVGRLTAEGALFFRACAKGTNVAEKRTTRYQLLVRALRGESMRR